MGCDNNCGSFHRLANLIITLIIWLSKFFGCVGIELVDTYATHDLDKQKYENKMILILGGGNSAFESAHHFSDAAAIVHVVFNKRIQFAWNTHFVGKRIHYYKAIIIYLFGH